MSSIRSGALWTAVATTALFTVGTFISGYRAILASSPEGRAGSGEFPKTGRGVGIGALTFSQDVVVTLFLVFFVVVGYAAAFMILFDFIAHTTALVIVSSIPDENQTPAATADTSADLVGRSAYTVEKALGIVSACAFVLGLAVLVMTLRYGAILSARTGNASLRLLSLLFAVIGVFSVFTISNQAVRESLDSASRSSRDVARLVQEISLM